MLIKIKLLINYWFPLSYLLSLFCEWRRWPQDIDGSCECIE